MDARFKVGLKTDARKIRLVQLSQQIELLPLLIESAFAVGLSLTSVTVTFTVAVSVFGSAAPFVVPSSVTV